jgi:hypothetical protein
MVVKVIEQKWREQVLNRDCGSCHACCIWLGIDELQKWTGERCKHLATRTKTHHCGIYDSRPKACVQYQCMWLAGWGPDNLQPSKSGMLITPYQNETDAKMAAVTIVVFDLEKAQKLLMDVITQILQFFIDCELRVVSTQTKVAMLYKDGLIRKGKLIPSKDLEALDMEIQDKPISSYIVGDLKDFKEFVGKT